MKLLFIGLMAAAMMATVGAYAASITGTTKTLGGTGSVTVSAPATSASVAFTSDAAGQVTAAVVTWTPAANSAYTIKVTMGASTGSLAVPTSGTVSRADSVTISPAVDADAVSTAKVVISQD